MEYYATIKNQALYMIPIDSLSNRRKNKLDFIKLKNFCGSKGTIMKVKRQPTNRNKYSQIIYLITVWYPEYINIVYQNKVSRTHNNSTIR